ncbi:MAG: phosphate butyryltransferase Ptb [bacterium]|nr:phosphate butyryltransferase Ptb [bacterium]
MALKHLSELNERALALKPHRRAVVVASHDSHILQAVAMAKKDELIDPVLVGHVDETKKILAELGESEDGYEFIEADSDEDCAITAIKLVQDKKVDIIIKGIIETPTLMRQVVKKENNVLTGLVSACGIFESEKYHKVYAMTDMGINQFPTLEKKAQIIQNAVNFLTKLGIENPKVAVLSSTERVNPKQQDTVEAAELKAMNERGEITGCIVEGPISLDLALMAESAKTKGYSSPVAGDADLLMVPDIVSGNLLVKGIGIFGGPKSMDAVLGCVVPIVFGSRGGPIEAKYNSIVLAAITAGE